MYFNRLLENKITQIRKPYGFDTPEWCKDFLNQIEYIQQEWKTYRLNRDAGTPIDELSKDQESLNTDKKWKSVLLYGYGYSNDKELVHFPVTAGIIKAHQEQLTLVMFSITEAGKHIPPHHGNNSGVLRLQIGIDIPEPDQCTLRVEDKKVALKEKEIFIFDDTFEHELMNSSQSHRAVLIIDYYKPLPFLYRILNKRKIAKIAQSNYVQSVINKIK